MKSATTNTVRVSKGSDVVTFSMEKGGPAMMANSRGEMKLLTLDEARERIGALVAAGWTVIGALVAAGWTVRAE